MDFRILTDLYSDVIPGQQRGDEPLVIPASFAEGDTSSLDALVSPLFEGGSDILYIGASNLLSPIYDAACGRLDGTVASYAGRKVVHVDSLSAGIAEGMLVDVAIRAQKEGATVDEARRAVLDARMHLAFWFTASTDTNRLIGTKPISHVANGGNIIEMDHVHGMGKALQTLADKVDELGMKPFTSGQIVLTSVAAEEDAKTLSGLLSQRLGLASIECVPMGAATSELVSGKMGAGVVGVAFTARKR